jgi:RNA polymerase sigma-70 factor (ECF subfamily)
VDEPALLAAAQRGDERAFARLLDCHRCGLRILCLMMLGTGHAAQRAMDDTTLIAWRARELVQPATTIRLWLYRIATDVCVQQIGESPMTSGAEDRLTSERPRRHAARREDHDTHGQPER